jgi:hypothetical protein
VTSDTNLRVFAQLLPRFSRVAVFLPQMHAIRLDPLGEGYAVIDDEGNVVGLADFLQRRGQFDRLVLVDAFHAKLEGGNWPCRKRFFKAGREIATDIERRNEIKLAVGSGHGLFIEARANRCKCK